MPVNTLSYEEVEAALLADPEFRAEWERTAFARMVANRVVRYRIDHKLSQRALAKRLGVSQALVARLELGEHEPRLSTLQTLARALGMRFTIDIHPAGQPPATELPHVDRRVERMIADGVETMVLAG